MTVILHFVSCLALIEKGKQTVMVDMMHTEHGDHDVNCIGLSSAL